MLKMVAPCGGKKIIYWFCFHHGIQMGLISLLFRWSFRLKRRTVKQNETDVHMLGCVISDGNSFSFDLFRGNNF